MAQQKPKQRTKQQPTNRPTMLSKERIVDSDSDGPEESEAELKKPISKPPASIKKQTEKKKALTNGKKHKTPELESGSEIESPDGKEDAIEDEASEAKSDNESDASSSSANKRPAPPTRAAPPEKKAKPTPPTAIAPKAFNPPEGFEKTTFSVLDYAADSTEFLTEGVSRKQVWHITAPASFNIKDIKPFNIQDVRSGKPIFSKNGIDYGFLTGLHKTERLLLANGEDVEYTQAMAPISGTYHLREIGRSKKKNKDVAEKENLEISFAAKTIVSAQKPREQPAGLRMRYRPYGSTAATALSRSPPTFRIAPELPESQLDKSAKKKQRKEKKASQQAKQSSQDVDAMEVDPTPSSTVKNPPSGKPAESATKMVEKVFEAAIETPSKEKKRKKKKHRIAEEVDA